jgi:hypothetical protein
MMPTQYHRLPRKSVWLSQDEYNTLNGLKGQYEANSGGTDWGKFLILLAGIAIGVGFLNVLSNSNQQNMPTNNQVRLL